jgi:hypothetical protein
MPDVDVDLVSIGVTDIAEAVIAYCIGSVVTGVLLLKGKGWTTLLYVFVPVVGTAIGLIAVVRLAKPNSWWARHRYGTYELRDARSRFPKTPLEPGEALPALGWTVLVLGAAGLLVGLVIGLPR